MAVGSAGKVACASVAWALWHSLLAARGAKALAARLAGRRRRDGLYRVAYNALSLATAGAFALWFLRQPDRELYHVPPPWSRLLATGQLASAGLLAWAICAGGFGRNSGLAPLARLLAGRDPAPAPEAQGPPPGPDGELRPVGPFRYTRHPDNLPVLGLAWLFPRMTANRAALAAVASAYAVIGSLHEDARLRAAHGAAFERYRRRHPFFWPRLRAATARPEEGVGEGRGDGRGAAGWGGAR